MQFATESKDPSLLPGTSSQIAEIGLIENLLELKHFKKPQIQRRLAVYPYESYAKKNELICELMKLLWPEQVKIDLFSIYKDFDYFMTATGRKGHFIHQFEVFLLGLNLLLVLWKKKPNLSIFKAKSKEELINIWLITATTHDCGYPLQIAPDIVNDLSNLCMKLNLKYLSDRFDSIKFKDLLKKEHELKGLVIRNKSQDEIISEYISIEILMKIILKSNLKLSSDEIQKLIDKFVDDANHGYVSSIILCNILLDVVINDLSDPNKFKDDWLFNKLNFIAGAISLHSLDIKDRKYIRKISFEDNPYAYILFLIDNIQDWSRAIVPNTKYAEYQLKDFNISDNE
ncbi:MAG: hypothetical protein KAR08_03315, partial [Candidatus Heimdallarchaeota archaeon]|nr:hypothetical protein [Candidatus Heimdallarchaeota archaeon]